MESTEQDSQLTHEPFKSCGCGTTWATRHAFLHDPELEIIGYQPNLKLLDLGLFLFNHACHTTLAIKAGELIDLHDGDPVENTPPENKRPTDLCIKSTLDASCPPRCTCRFVKNVVKTVKGYQEQV